jgi:Lon protease-like protein
LIESFQALSFERCYFSWHFSAIYFVKTIPNIPFPMHLFELPLFPLDVVLFPGMPLSLHIFEERYKQMIRTCLDKDQPFGIVLNREDNKNFGAHWVGCTAKISDMQPLTQGRMNIQVVGTQRFRIRVLDTNQPYLTGQVDFLPALYLPSDTAQPTGDVLRLQMLTYLQQIASVTDGNFLPETLPTDVLPLTYLGCVVLQIPHIEKQGLLEMDHAIPLFEKVHWLFRRENALLRVAIRQGIELGRAGYRFSPN